MNAKTKSILIISALVVFSACETQQARYEWTTTISGESRRAIIWTAKEKDTNQPVVIYFHGRGGDAEDSEERRKFHNLWPEAMVVYAEGTNFDNGSDNKKGWEIRFPHLYSVCKLEKDYKYVEKLLDHVDDQHSADMSRVYIAGHSSGAFFTLSLTEIMNSKFKAAAALGSYTSFAPAPGFIDCNNTYADGIVIPAPLFTTFFVNPNPMRTFFIFGDKENTIKKNNPDIFNSDCGIWSYPQNSVYQLIKKNLSNNPTCTGSFSFMDQYSKQTFNAQGSSGVATTFRLYDGAHSWPNQANTWVIDYFKNN